MGTVDGMVVALASLFEFDAMATCHRQNNGQASLVACKVHCNSLPRTVIQDERH